MYAILAALPAETGVMAVVKADAYGHDALAVARHLQDLPGVWGFGVGDSHEALALREGKITSPILILGAIIEDEIGRVLENDISVCVHSNRRVERLNREALRQGRRLKVHLMVDTGMGRLGVPFEKAAAAAGRIADAAGLEFAGVATHYSSTHDPNDPFTLQQLERFLEIKERLARAGISPEIFHASNSAAIFSRLDAHFNVVRPGISLYGISPSEAQSAGVVLKPVLSFRTQVVFMKDMPAGAPVGYNRGHVTNRRTRIATLPIGYNDGYAFRLSGRGQVLIRGRRAPVVGAVSMDYTMVDIGHIRGVEVGDLVTLIGRDGGESISVEEMAATVGTIPYEITCAIGKRVRRIPRKMKQGEVSESRDGGPGLDAARAETALM